jgi:hypothetical protein
MKDNKVQDMDDYVRELACTFASTDNRYKAICRLSTSLLIQLHNLENFMVSRGIKREDFESYCDNLQYDLNNRLN